MDRIRGRGSELGVIKDFVHSLSERPSALLLAGAAGIGKTTLWHEGLTYARSAGHRLLSSRAAESEARLSYGTLGDLLDFELPDLPIPQKRALDAALLRTDAEGAPPDQRAVSLATLGALRALAASGPVILAIDDIQWMDAPSAKVLSFVIRRLEDEPIGMLVTLRGSPRQDPLGLAKAAPALNLRQMSVDSLSEEEMIRLLRDRTGDRLAHPVLVRLHRISEGNPFFALEMARALGAQGLRPAPGRPLPAPEDFQDLLEKRLAALSSSALDALLVVAAVARPTENVFLAASGRADRASADLREAEQAEIVRLHEDEIRFTHPLLGSTVYALASPEARRRVHQRLADLVDDLEERARHLALAVDGPDERVAQALDDASEHARARGAPDAAAELSELAAALTPAGNPTENLRRIIESAEHHFDAGDATRATTLLEEAVAATPPGRTRAPVLFRLGSISWMNMPRVQELMEQSLAEAEDDDELLTNVHEHLAWVGIYKADLSLASQHARVAEKTARRVDNLASRSDALSTFGMVEFLMGGQQIQEVMSEAVRFEDLATTMGPGNQRTVYTSARSCNGLQLLWAGELNAARTVLQQELTEYESAGRYVVRDELLAYLAELESRAGNWDLARRYAHEAVEIGADSGHLQGRDHMLFPRALIGALQGDVEAAKSDASEGLEISLRNEDFLVTNSIRAVLGFLELSLSNPTAAMQPLEEVLDFLNKMGSDEPGIIPCLPDAIECMVAAGRLEDAEDLVEDLERQGRARGRPWAIATAARCRGLIAGARGNLSEAGSALERALTEHEAVPQPFELARTLLAKGDVERRAKQKRASRASLGQAIEIFERLGARLWTAKAEASLARAGGTLASTNELTPTENRIAGLVCEGKKNREIADALFISVKTVESNLSRVFHKLEVRSRTELIRRLTSGSP